MDSEVQRIRQKHDLDGTLTQSQLNQMIVRQKKKIRLMKEELHLGELEVLSTTLSSDSTTLSSDSDSVSFIVSSRVSSNSEHMPSNSSPDVSSSHLLELPVDLSFLDPLLLLPDPIFSLSLSFDKKQDMAQSFPWMSSLWNATDEFFQCSEFIVDDGIDWMNF